MAFLVCHKGTKDKSLREKAEIKVTSKQSQLEDLKSLRFLKNIMQYFLGVFPSLRDLTILAKAQGRKG